MAWTYATLSAALQAQLETDETTFVAEIPNIIRRAEDRILTKAQLPVFRKNTTGTYTASNQYLAIPADFLAQYSLSVDGATYEFLLFKPEANFIREAFPDVTVEGEPRYYAIYDDEKFIIGPTPDSNYAYELHYFHRPDSIVDAGTSWLGTNAPTTLFDACVEEAYVFLKGDPDLVEMYRAKVNDSIPDLKLIAEGRNKVDMYRGI